MRKQSIGKREEGRKEKKKGRLKRRMRGGGQERRGVKKNKEMRKVGEESGRKGGQEKEVK